MDAPTLDLIRSWTRVDLTALGYLESDTDDPLDVLLDRAIEYVQTVTGRELASMPSQFEQTANEAIQRRIEQLAFQSQEDSVETAAEFELIQSFSAGSYSEQRRSMDEMRKARLVNPWPLLHDLLWRMMTEDMRDQWLAWFADQLQVPAFAVSEVDWSGQAFDDSVWGA